MWEQQISRVDCGHCQGARNGDILSRASSAGSARVWARSRKNLPQDTGPRSHFSTVLSRFHIPPVKPHT